MTTDPYIPSAPAAASRTYLYPFSKRSHIVIGENRPNVRRNRPWNVGAGLPGTRWRLRSGRKLPSA
jgi:hypothetical protein